MEERYSVQMITVLVRVTHGPEALAATLSALVPAVAAGLVGDAVILADRQDDTLMKVADAAGATLVVANGGPEAVQTRHPLDDSRCDLRVQPDHIPLLPTQRPWFQQHALAYPELADVAEQRREQQLLSFRGLQAEALRYSLNISRDLA